jgi:hypothetical protein
MLRKVVDAASLVASGRDVKAFDLWNRATQIDKFTLGGGGRQSCESDADGGERFTYGYTATSGATLNITWMTIGSGSVAPPRKIGDGPLQCLYTPTQCATVGFDAATPPIDAAHELVANSFKFSFDYRPPASGYATANAMLLIDAFVAIAHPGKWMLPTDTNTTFAGTRVVKSRGITQQTTDGRFSLRVDFPFFAQYGRRAIHVLQGAKIEQTVIEQSIRVVNGGDVSIRCLGTTYLLLFPVNEELHYDPSLQILYQNFAEAAAAESDGASRKSSTPSGLSPGGVAAIVIVVLLLAAASSGAAMFVVHRRKSAHLQQAAAGAY